MKLKKIPLAPNAKDLNDKQHALLRAAREELTIARRALKNARMMIFAAMNLEEMGTTARYSLASVGKFFPSIQQDTEDADRRLTKWIGKHSFYEDVELLDGKK